MKKKQKKIIKKGVKKVKSAQIDLSAQTGNSKIIPLGSRILIKPFTKEELEKKSSFGIILPNSDPKEKSEQGIVLAVGPGEIHDGKRIPPLVKIGDKVAFSKYGYDDIMIDGEELFLIKEENVLAILK